MAQINRQKQRQIGGYWYFTINYSMTDASKNYRNWRRQSSSYSSNEQRLDV